LPPQNLSNPNTEGIFLLVDYVLTMNSVTTLMTPHNTEGIFLLVDYAQHSFLTAVEAFKHGARESTHTHP
jgi:hypothetical protein